MFVPSFFEETALIEIHGTPAEQAELEGIMDHIARLEVLIHDVKARLQAKAN